MASLLRGKLFGPMLLAFILGLGAAVAWIFAYLILQAIIGSMSVRTNNESIDVRRDGQVFIAHSEREAGRWFATYRTLDGKEVSPSDGRAATVVQLMPPLGNKSASTIEWNQRISGTADTRRDQEFWYLIHDQYAVGRAYYEIFDSRSRQSLGFFGPDGFRVDRPPVEEQFADVPVTGHTESTNPYRGPSRVASTNRLYLIAEGKVWSIDLAERSLRELPVPGDPMAIAMMLEDKSGENESFNLLLVVRTRDEIVVMTDLGDTIHTLRIPEPLRDRLINAYNVTAAETVLVSHITSRWYDPEIYWVGGPETEVRHQSVRLGVAGDFDQDSVTWELAVVGPSPLALLGAYLLSAHNSVELGSDETMATALAKSIARDWPALLLVLAMSAALAVWTFRRQSRYAVTGAEAWAVFVLVTGVPGAVGYWLHRCWPVSEVCRACGFRSPRDRDGCLACAAEFPVPELCGIEILA